MRSLDGARGLGALGPMARSLGWRLDRADREALRVVNTALTAGEAPRVAILAGGRRPNRFGLVVRRALPGVTVVRLDPRLSASALHARLAAGGPYDLVVDDTRRPRSRGRMFAAAFFHLRPGGVYLAADFTQQEETLGGETPPWGLGTLLARIEQAGARPAPGAGQKDADRRALGRSIESVRSAGGHLVLVNGTRALAKLYEHEANEVLVLRGGEDRVLSTVDAATFASRCTFSSSTGERHKMMPDVYTTPVISLREYRDAVCIPGQVVVKDNLLLPDTYRHNERKRLRNGYTEELGPRFAAVEHDLDGVDYLEGTYFYLDNEVRGHFGHAMTEQVSRLWALAEARRAAPDLKAIMAINKGRELQDFEVTLYGAVGLAREDLVFRHEPARVERLLAATPMLSMPQYIHPEIVPVWDLFGDNLAATATGMQTPDRIFVSRRIRKRACLNTPDVEGLFADNGFEVVYPEDYPLGDQVAMFRKASVVAGFAGSGLFNICFAQDPKTVIMLEHEAYTATNEYLISSLRGHDLVAIVSPIARTERDEQRGVNRFQSSFRVDLDREGRYLERVLKEL